MGSSNSASRLAEQQRYEREVALTKGKKNIDKAFGVFTPEFYAQRKQDYLDFARPQLARQYGQSQNQLGFSLANRGLQRSSQARGATRDLNITMGDKQRQIVDQAQQQANSLQSGVEQQRNNLYGTLAATLDPSMAQTAALGAAQAYTAPSAFVPIGNLFADWSQNYLARLNNKTFSAAETEIPKLNFAPAPGRS